MSAFLCNIYQYTRDLWKKREFYLFSTFIFTQNYRQRYCYYLKSVISIICEHLMRLKIIYTFLTHSLHFYIIFFTFGCICYYLKKKAIVHFIIYIFFSVFPNKKCVKFVETILDNTFFLNIVFTLPAVRNSTII